MESESVSEWHHHDFATLSSYTVGGVTASLTSSFAPPTFCFAPPIFARFECVFSFCFRMPYFYKTMILEGLPRLKICVLPKHCKTVGNWHWLDFATPSFPEISTHEADHRGKANYPLFWLNEQPYSHVNGTTFERCRLKYFCAQQLRYRDARFRCRAKKCGIF